MEMDYTALPYDTSQDLHKNRRPPAPSREDIVLNEHELEFLNALLEDDPWQQTRERSGLRRDAFRQRQNNAASYITEMTRLSSIVMGISSKSHPILRENAIKQMLFPVLVRTRDDMVQLERQAPAMAAYTQLIDIFQSVAEEQIAPAVESITDNRGQYRLMRQFIDETEHEDKTEAVKEFVWSSAFYFAHGGYGKHQPVLDQLEVKITQGEFDTCIAEELLDYAEPDSEIAKMQAFAKYMAGDATGWRERLLDRMDLFPSAIQKQIVERRQELSKNLRDTIDGFDTNFGPILRGVHLDVREEIQEIQARIRQKQLRKLGRTVVQTTAPPASIRRRWNSSDPTNPTDVDDSGMPEVQQQSLKLAETVYNYRHAESTDTSLDDLLQDYAGNNPKLLEALRESTTHIAERFGRDERGNGIKKVRGSANKSELLWEFKPKEAVDIGQVGRAIDQTRMFFVVKEDTIHIVDVFARTKYNEKMKNLGLGR